MKKLRLIKPWRLRATRLKLTDARWGGDELIYYAACAAPGVNAMEATEAFRYAVGDTRAVACMQVAHNIACTAAPGRQNNYTQTVSLSVR